MKPFIKTGQLLYGFGLMALGVHQLLLLDFRPEIIPAFPALLHHFIFFPVTFGIILIFAGVKIMGLITINFIATRTLCLYVGFFFLAVTILFHLPDILFFSPNPISRLDVWFGAGESLAYSGGAFVMAGFFPAKNVASNSFESMMEKLIPWGGSFFSTLMIVFGFSHFVFTPFVSTMVPKWIGAPLFWTYFCGVALMGAGIAFILKIWLKPVGLLLTLMLFLFFLFFHVPDAIANPTAGKGNEIFRAIVCLLFCGISLGIAATGKPKRLAN